MECRQLPSVGGTACELLRLPADSSKLDHRRLTATLPPPTPAQAPAADGCRQLPSVARAASKQVRCDRLTAALPAPPTPTQQALVETLHQLQHTLLTSTDSTAMSRVSTAAVGRQSCVQAAPPTVTPSTAID